MQLCTDHWLWFVTELRHCCLIRETQGVFFFVVHYAVKYDIQVKNGVVVNNQKVQPPTVPSLDTRFVAAASITHSHRHGKLRMQLY